MASELWVARDQDDENGEAWVWLIQGPLEMHDGEFRGEDFMRVEAKDYPDLAPGTCRRVTLNLEPEESPHA